MSASVNKVILIGNLAKDPEVRSMQSGGKVANLTVATSERWKSKDTGEWQERSEFHRVSVMNDRLAEVAERYLRKGSKVYLEGQLETRKWQSKDGQDKYTTEIVLRNFRGELTMLDGKSDSAPSGGQRSWDGGSSSGPSRAPARHRATTGNQNLSILDDDPPPFG